MTVENDIKAQVETALREAAFDADVDNITQEIIATYGLVSLGEVDAVVFWEIVQRHEHVSTAGRMFTVSFEACDAEGVWRPIAPVETVWASSSAPVEEVAVQARQSAADWTRGRSFSRIRVHVWFGADADTDLESAVTLECQTREQ